MIVHFNIYPMVRPAPSIVRKELERKLASKRLLLEQKTLLNVPVLHNPTFSQRLHMSLVLCRGFATSPYYKMNEDLEQGVNPFNTYGESPIESDVEGSTEKLADKYIGNPSGLIAEQTGKMESLSEKSKIFISELVLDRGLERSKLQPSELEPFDKETRELINSEAELANSELNRIATIRDDALDLIAGRSRSHDSDYESDYESDTSVDRVQAEYSNLDSSTAEIISDHSRFFNSALENLPNHHANATSHPENFTSPGEPSSTVETKPSVEAGSSHSHSIAGSSNKRKREDTDIETSAKNPKISDSTMDVDNAFANIPSNSQSAIDYVLEKQQCDPYDISDDID